MKQFSPRLLLVSLFVALVGLVAPSRPGSVASAQAQLTNLLTNPSFEEPYSNGAAQGWSRWHQELNSNPKPANCADRYLVRPSWEGELASGGLIREGARSQHVGNSFDTWRAGVMQTLPATPGMTYRFTFYATGRATNDQYPAPSDGSVNLGVRGGIDPNGSGVWSDGDIVWGGSGSPHMSGSEGAWQQFAVEATATGNQITVFVQGDTGGANQCRAHLDVWFDSAQLVEAGPPPTNTPPPPPPRPVITNTPVPPTATATPPIPPTSTPIPTDTPSPTPTPPETGVLCANAFADNNRNGQRDADEGFMAGVAFTIAQDGQAIGQGISTGTATPVCFEDLLPGSYIVAQQIPRNLEMTTAPSATVELTAGSTISLEFGSTIAPEVDGDEVAAVTPDAGGDTGGDTGEDSASDGGPSPITIIGLVAIIIAIIMLGALIFILLRQQRSSGDSG